MVDSMPIKKPIPISVQILYALGFIGLIVGLGLAAAIFMLSSPSPYPLFLGLTAQLLAIGLGLVIVFGFVLISKIHSGKRWALITYSILVALNSIQTVIANPLAIRSYLVAALPVAFLAFIWIKDRAYFS